MEEKGGGFVMKDKKSSKFGRLRAFVASFLVLIGLVFGIGGAIATDAYAVNEGETTTQNEQNITEESNNKAEETTATATTADCKDSLGSIGWLVCPTTGKIAEAVDFLYDKIEDILVIQPISAEDGTPVYEIWKYCLNITNIIFIIFLLVVIYSQITGMGISNYGIKKALPKLIITAVIVNLSFLICLLAVDISNIIGNSLRGLFTSVEEAALASSSITNQNALNYSSMYSSLAGGTALAIGGTAVAFETGAIWMLIPTVLGAIVAVATGLITIALRQAIVILLVMISPLAMVACILPNTEKWFKKWKELFAKMLIFYPMFSLLFGASSLAGFAIIMSAKSGFGILLGMAVQIFPLFFSWKLMQMSGTILGDINTKMRGMTARPLAANRAWAGSHKAVTAGKYGSKENPVTPSLRLTQFLSKRSVERAEKTKDYASTIQARGLAYTAGRNYKRDRKTGKRVMSKSGERAYLDQARRMQYQAVVDDHNVDFNEGLADYFSGNANQKSRLNRLDMMNMNAAGSLKMISARGMQVDYRNAEGFHKAMEGAINAHIDLENGFEYMVDSNGEYVLDENGNKIKVKRKTHKFHLDPNNIEASAEMARYNSMYQIMHGNELDTQFIATVASNSYEAQKNIISSQYQKYFELTPSSKDVVYKLTEFTKRQDAKNYIDAIVPGLRILNQRGDTDIVREQIENILNGGDGVELGTHASQALASFLMFEVKDGDPILRRFGKYINLETAQVYNKNKRQNTKFTYDEFITGEYQDWDANDPTIKKVGKSKQDIVRLMNGTSLDGIERTTLGSLDDALKKTYTDANGKLDEEKYLARRKEVENSMTPALISAIQKFPSGSEQIKAATAFLTGINNGTPRWEDEEDALYGSEYAEAYFRNNAISYIRNQTPAQILGMRSDLKDALVEHFANEYLHDSSDNETIDERKKKYEKQKAKIMDRYKNEPDAEKAESMRKADLQDLKMDIAGRQMRKELGETGKLAQIYESRPSGAANNAKDWVRKMVGLEDLDALRKEVKYYNEKAKVDNKAKAEPEAAAEDGFGRIYDEGFKSGLLARLEKIYEDSSSYDIEDFYVATYELLEKHFGDSVIIRKYERYKKDYPSATIYDLNDWLKNELSDLDNYPGANSR